MKKVWFILEENFHRGPFTFEELQLMFEHKKLKDNDLIWREGLPSGVPYHEINQLELLKIEASIPAIPSEAKLPVLNELMDSPRRPGKPSSMNLPDSPPVQIKPVQIKNETLVVKQSDEGSANQMELPPIKKTSGEKIFKLYFAALATIIVFVALVIFYQFSFKEPKIPQPLTMLGDDHERLSEVVKLRRDKKFAHTIAVSKNFDTIWLSTNYPYSGRVQIEFASFPAKTTRNMTIIGKSVGELDNFLATFSQPTFTSGERLVQGVYHFKVKLVEEYPASLIKKLVYKERSFPAFEFDAYVGFGSEEQFLKHLGSVTETQLPPKAEIESDAVLKLIEKQESLKTLLTLIQMTHSKTEKLFFDIKEKKLVSKKKELIKLVDDYEHGYVSEVAPLLSSLGQDTNLELSRKFGAHFMSTLSQLRKFSTQKKIDSKKLDRFGQSSVDRFVQLTQVLETDLKSLEIEMLEQKTQEKK